VTVLEESEELKIVRGLLLLYRWKTSYLFLECSKGWISHCEAISFIMSLEKILEAG